MAAYEFWTEFQRCSFANSYEGFRDRFLSLMPDYYRTPRAQRRRRRLAALRLYRTMTPEQRIEFNRGAWRPTVA